MFGKEQRSGKTVVLGLGIGTPISSCGISVPYVFGCNIVKAWRHPNFFFTLCLANVFSQIVRLYGKLSPRFRHVSMQLHSLQLPGVGKLHPLLNFNIHAHTYAFAASGSDALLCAYLPTHDYVV